MKGDKYLEIGNRQKIGVKRFVSPSGEARYKICQGNGVYQGSIAGDQSPTKNGQQKKRRRITLTCWRRRTTGRRRRNERSAEAVP
ncbi:MAG: hypothetical protein IJ233_03450 [Pyramidobacter sp.]|nr:hypothetical protein [Pyramidobacter sp.]